MPTPMSQVCQVCHYRQFKIRRASCHSHPGGDRSPGRNALLHSMYCALPNMGGHPQNAIRKKAPLTSFQMDPAFFLAVNDFMPLTLLPKHCINPPRYIKMTWKIRKLNLLVLTFKVGNVGFYVDVMQVFPARLTML